MFLPPDLKGKVDYFELCPDLTNRIDLNLSTPGVQGSDRGYDMHVSLSDPVVAPLRLIPGRFIPPFSFFAYPDSVDGLLRLPSVLMALS